MEQTNIGVGSEPQASASSEHEQILSMWKKIEKLSSWCNGKLKSEWQKELEQRLEASATAEQEMKTKVERLTNDVETTLQEQDEKIKWLTKQNAELRQQFDRSLRCIDVLSSLRPLAETLASQKTKAEESAREAGKKEKETELSPKITSLQTEVEDLKKENEGLREEKEAAENECEKARREKCEKEGEENEDPHCCAQNGRDSWEDVKNQCSKACKTILDNLKKACQTSTEPEGCCSERLQKAAEYMRELFVATFNDSVDDPNAFVSSSLAERLSSVATEAEDFGEIEKTIKDKVSQIKKIYSNWRRENRNVVNCNVYLLKKDDLPSEREEAKSYQALGAERLNRIEISKGERVLLTLIPGIYSKTKGSTANLAPAYVVVAPPRQAPEVEESCSSAVAPTTVKASKAEKAPTTANAASPVENARDITLEMDKLSPTPVCAEARTPKKTTASTRAPQPSAVLGETNAKNDDDSDWPGFHADWNAESDAS